jgi:hypothetical protein
VNDFSRIELNMNLIGSPDRDIFNKITINQMSLAMLTRSETDNKMSFTRALNIFRSVELCQLMSMAVDEISFSFVQTISK